MNAKSTRANATFRVNDRAPELWDPRTGEIRNAPEWRRAGAGTEVTLDLAGNGSTFVVFRRGGTPPRSRKPVSLPQPVAIDGPWAVSFGGGPSTQMTRLASWTESPERRHFAGTARYSTKFVVPPGWRTSAPRVFIDLGRLWTVGQVQLNGKPLGIAWTDPFRVEATGALRDGENELVVEVTNTWYNRLVGDAKLPPPERTTRTNVTTSDAKPWSQLQSLESGLFGPVRLIATENN
jgi:hypothetical protein